MLFYAFEDFKTLIVLKSTYTKFTAHLVVKQNSCISCEILPLRKAKIPLVKFPSFEIPLCETTLFLNSHIVNDSQIEGLP